MKYCTILFLFYRDNYDKEVKAKQQQGKFHMKPHSHTSKSKQKKPEIQTYIPPQRSKKGNHDIRLHMD